MGKRWAAGAFLALALLWAVSALPAARGQETSPAASPLKTAGEAESGEVLAVEALEEPEDSLEDLRTIRAADVAAENLDAARWAVYRDLPHGPRPSRPSTGSAAF